MTQELVPALPDGYRFAHPKTGTKVHIVHRVRARIDSCCAELKGWAGQALRYQDVPAEEGQEACAPCHAEIQVLAQEKRANGVATQHKEDSLGLCEKEGTAIEDCTRENHEAFWARHEAKKQAAIVEIPKAKRGRPRGRKAAPRKTKSKSACGKKFSAPQGRAAHERKCTDCRHLKATPAASIHATVPDTRLFNKAVEKAQEEVARHLVGDIADRLKEPANPGLFLVQVLVKANSPEAAEADVARVGPVLDVKRARLEVV